MSNIIEATDETFNTLIESATSYVLVDFYANWCVPCKLQAEFIAELAPQLTSVLFLKVNVEEAIDVGSSYNIRALPTMQLWFDGKLYKTWTKGVLKTEHLRDFILE
jgi:thioredoxin 1